MANRALESESRHEAERVHSLHWLSTVKDLGAIIAVVIALVTLVKGLHEYSIQGTQRRAEYFLQMRHRFKDDDELHRIALLLENNDDALLNLPLEEKVDYVGFFEEIALLTNSGYVRPEVAQYMFGYYAIQCWNNNKFWNNMRRDSKYWSLFRDFVQRMEKIRDNFEYRRKDFRL